MGPRLGIAIMNVKAGIVEVQSTQLAPIAQGGANALTPMDMLDRADIAHECYQQHDRYTGIRWELLSFLQANGAAPMHLEAV